MSRYYYGGTKSVVLIYIVTFALVGAISFGIAYASAYFEAAAYERATGHRVSPWDAMFIELRVQDSPKEQPK